MRRSSSARASGELSGKAIRIAHYGPCQRAMMLGTLSVVEVGLQLLASRTARAAPRRHRLAGEQVKA